MDIDAIQQIFFQECDEGLAGMEVAFAALHAGDSDSDGETINSIFRCVHSIKGGAGAFGHVIAAADNSGFELRKGMAAQPVARDELAAGVLKLCSK